MYVEAIKTFLIAGDDYFRMVWQCRKVLNSIFVVVGSKISCILQNPGIHITYYKKAQHLLYSFQNGFFLIVLWKYISTIHNAKRRYNSRQIAIINH